MITADLVGKLINMSAVKHLQPISVEDYLTGELVSPIKHEYVAGRIYAMTGARNAHNIIATNIAGLLHARLRGKPCSAFNSDTKVRVRRAAGDSLYYPDASVVCQPNSQDVSYQERPVVVFEVISESTRRTDEGEKKEDYLSLTSLQVYALVEQSSAAIVVYRRQGDKFVLEAYDGLDATLILPEIGTELPLREIYERVEFSGDDQLPER